jgi:hypothetical protein
VIHTAFIYDFSHYAANAEIERQAMEAIGATLAGSGRPFVVTSGTLDLTSGRLGTEGDAAMGLRGSGRHYGRCGSRKSARPEGKIDLKALEPMFFVGMSEKAYPGSNEWLIDACREAGFTPRILQEADREPAVISFVASGLGVACFRNKSKGCLTKGWASFLYGDD